MAESIAKVTLIEGVDYTLNTATGVLTLSADYLYRWIEASWVYYYTNSFGLCETTTSELEETYGDALMALVAFMVAGATLVSIAWFIYFLRPLFDKEKGLASLSA
jgi:hypothetical protein